MSISRRIFIQTATVAAIAAGTLARPTWLSFAQATKKSADPLAYYTQATFTQYLNSVFRIHGFVAVDVTLEKVEDNLPATVSRTGGRESFVLHFRGGSAQLGQDTYTIEHPALGVFKMFLVPSGPDKNGAQAYTATINRLEYSAKTGPTPKAVPRKTAPSPPSGPESSQPAKPGIRSPEAPRNSTPEVKPRIRKSDPDRSIDPEN